MTPFDSTDTQFTTADLVEFATYLFSDERLQRIADHNPEGKENTPDDLSRRMRQVTHADLCNWAHKFHPNRIIT